MLLHSTVPTNTVWTTSNAGEALPGSLTPLSWTLFGTAAEAGLRYAFHRIGVLPAAQLPVPTNDAERILAIFHGHAALKVDFLCEMGSRIPGSTGEEMAMQILGSAPASLPRGRQFSRYPHVAVRLPWQLVTMRRQLNGMVKETGLDWWRDGVRRAPTLSMSEALAQMRDAYTHFGRALNIQTVSLVGAVQPTFDVLQTLIKSSGRDDLRADLMCGYGSHVESAMVCDMWRISRGLLSVQQFLDHYGFHGPREGEISGTVWREDPAPLQRLIDGYRCLDDTADPARIEEENMRLRQTAERQLLQSIPRRKRPLAVAVLRAAHHYIPMRGIGKAAFLAGLDVLRATARRIGDLLIEEGIIEDRQDVFYLTLNELLGELPAGAATDVGIRRTQVEENAQFVLPRWWQGAEPQRIALAAPGSDDTHRTVRGIGASAGVVEGVVKVVTNPDFADVPDNCVLVSSTTDPSWVPLMYLSKALVVDIGGELSHAAIVARELGVPCVVGTTEGTRVLRSGDLCRVDGTTGTVEILQRASKSA